MDYYRLTKPGIIYGNIITASGAFLYASHGAINWLLFSATIIGLSLAIACACVVNNIVDRDIDARMERTRDRALVSGRISIKSAFIFAAILGASASLILFFVTNLLVLVIAVLIFVIYIGIYSPAKRTTMYSTHIGAFAGALPPVLGYEAVANSLDVSVALIFLILCVWQIAHFYSIGMYRRDEYAAAGLPIITTQRGPLRVKIEIFIYVLAFALAAGALAKYGHASNLYIVIMTGATAIWAAYAFEGFWTINDKRWARKMFYCSLLVILCFSVDIALP